ncbi:MAG: acyltransferase domain-containing protein, partial [Planctomycetes bacterium]|nr:acyltransferase domain-containing protein [Planctomycetota bacterium]
MFPRARDLDTYWANIKNGVDAIEDVPPTHWSVEDFHATDPKAPDRTYGTRGGFLEPVTFDPLEFGLTPRALESTDSTQLLGLLVAREALRDAGYGPGERAFDPDRVSVILGVTGTLELVIPLGARLGHPIWRRALREAGVDPAVAQDVVRRISEAYVPWQEDSFPGLLGNVAAGRIANRLDLRGTNCVVDAACASSLSAIHMGALELGAGRADLVVTGGLDTFNDVFMYMCFSKTPALSPRSDARPFDAEADGTILGEGLGVLVLRRREDAERDGDRIYAVIRGIGSSSDGRGGAIYEPTVAGQVRALRHAYRSAAIPPATVELLEAHGTGTKVGDAVEVRALAEVYGAAEREGAWCALGSVKSQIGHTKAAAGAAGLIKAALALHYKVLPPTIKVSRPAPGLAPGESPFYVNAAKRPWLPPEGHPRRAAVSAFGFGGSNFHVVLEEHAAEKAAPDGDGRVQIAAFSGPEPRALLAQLDAWPESASWEETRALAARSRDAFRPENPCRLVLVLEAGRSEFAAVSRSARQRLAAGGEERAWSTPDGAHFGAGAAPGRLAALFPGQGSQYVGMLLDLVCEFPEMLEALALADRVVGPVGGRRLGALIYPPATFDREAAAANEEALRDTRAAQPALGAVSSGALGVLGRFGVRPAATAGHSYGELTALFAAGRLDAESLFLLSRLRGELMAGADDGRGGMIAVRSSAATMEAWLGEESLDLVVANRNAPEQVVLSGARAEVERAAERLAARGIGHRILNVSAAFHSPLVAAARAPFAAALADTPFMAGSIPVFANATATAYPAEEGAAREVL